MRLQSAVNGIIMQKESGNIPKERNNKLYAV